MPVGQRNREKECSAGNEISPVPNHVLSISHEKVAGRCERPPAASFQFQFQFQFTLVESWIDRRMGREEQQLKSRRVDAVSPELSTIAARSEQARQSGHREFGMSVIV